MRCSVGLFIKRLGVRIPAQEKVRRKAIMADLKIWLAKQGENQRWLAKKLGIYHGYTSNLLNGKQIAGAEVINESLVLMGKAPLKVPTKRPAARSKETKPSSSDKVIPAPPKVSPYRRPLTGAEMQAVASVAEAYLKKTPGVRIDDISDIIAKVRGAFTERVG